MLSRSKKLLLPLIALGLSAVGCGNVQSDRIDTICECQNCGDRQRQEVELIVTSQYDVAAAYNCLEPFEAYWECQLNQHDCRDGDYQDNNDDDGCGPELGQYMDCADDFSTRDPGPYF